MSYLVSFTPGFGDRTAGPETLYQNSFSQTSTYLLALIVDCCISEFVVCVCATSGGITRKINLAYDWLMLMSVFYGLKTVSQKWTALLEALLDFQKLFKSGMLRPIALLAVHGAELKQKKWTALHPALHGLSNHPKVACFDP